MALTDNLISVWEMDEASGNALDAHAANDLTVVNPGNVASVAGLIGNARDLTWNSSAGGHFNVASNSDLVTGDIDFSFTCWINAEAFRIADYIISKWQFSGGSFRSYAVYVANTTRCAAIAVTSDGSTQNVLEHSAFGALSTGAWYFIACGHSASSNEIWISVNNGTPATKSHTGGVDANTTAPFLIGAINTGSSNFWDGLVDQVAFWKRDLRATPGDLTAIYNSGNGLAYTSWAGDTTPPTLSLASATAAGSDTLAIAVTTDEDNGSLYWFVSTSATPPAAADLKAGTGATDFGNQAVSATGLQAIADVTGLSSGTTYYVYFLHADAAANDSSIVSDFDTTTSLPSITSVVMNADGQGGTITFDSSVSTIDVADFFLDDEFGTSKNIANLSGSGTTRTFTCDTCHKGVGLLLDYTGTDINTETDFNVDESAIVLTARITEYTTVSTKTAGFGCYSFTGKNSTLGQGVAVNHRFVWDITSYPVGFEYTVTDPRPGLQNGDTVNLRDGDWEGFGFAFPMTHAGSYTVRLTVYDEEGNSDSDSVVVTVAAQSSPTEIYVDGNAIGANNGTSPTDAFTSFDAGKAAFVASGNNTILYLAGGQTYTTSTDPTVHTGSNSAVLWDGTGITKPVIDTNGQIWWMRWTGDNFTLGSIDFTNTLNNDEGNVLWSESGLDAFINDCAIVAGGRMRSYSERSAEGPKRVLCKDADTSVGVHTQSGFFGEFDLLCVAGGVFGDIQTERAFRFTTDNTSTSLVAVDVQVDIAGKDCIRYQRGAYHSIHRCRIVADSGSCILLGSDPSSSAKHVQISRTFGRATEFGIRTNNTEANVNSDLAVRASWFQTINPTDLQPVFSIGGDFHRGYLVGNTIQSASNSANQAVFLSGLDAASPHGRFSSNLTSIENAVVSPSNDKALTIESTSEIYDNTLCNASNIGASDKYRVNGFGASLASLNGNPLASGNTETDSVTFSTLGSPSAFESSTCPPGLFTDYYGTPVTFALPIDRGAVQESSLPLGPTLSSANINAAGTTLTLVFSENMTGTVASLDVDGYTLSNGVLSGDTVTFDISQVYSDESPALDYVASLGDLTGAVSGEPLGDLTDSTITNNSAVSPLPTLTIDAATDITTSSGRVVGEETDPGRSTDRSAFGFVWAATPNPTLSDNVSLAMPLLGGAFRFTATLSGLPDNTTIYVRSYTTTAEGTGYSSQISFTTLDDPNPTIKSIRFSDGGTRIRIAFSEAVTGTTGVSVDAGTITYVSGSGSGVYLFSFTGAPTTVSYTPGNVVDSISQALGASGPTAIDPEPTSDIVDFIVLRLF